MEAVTKEDDLDLARLSGIRETMKKLWEFVPHGMKLDNGLSDPAYSYLQSMMNVDKLEQSIYEREMDDIRKNGT